jgi:hypothetical protein
MSVGLPEAPGARLCGREQANRDVQLSDANRGQAPDTPAALPDRGLALPVDRPQSPFVGILPP